MCSFLRLWWASSPRKQCRIVLLGVVEQVLQVGGANVQESGRAVGRVLGLEIGAHEHAPLQGPNYSVNEPIQGLLAAAVLVELDGLPEGRAGALLAMGSVGRRADQAVGREQGKCLEDGVVAVWVHGVSLWLVYG